MQTKLNRLSLAALLVAAPLAGHASTTACGPNICYMYDETQAAVALFGSPTLIGDSMRFIPPNFRAESNNTTGLGLSASTSANFIFDHVWAVTAGVEIGSVQVLEAGDYDISGDSAGNPDTVSVNLLTLVSNNASAETASDIVNFGASGDSSGTQVWILQGNAIDPATAFLATAHNVAINVQNSLGAYTDELGGDAWIQKKFTVTVGMAAPVPVPAAAWLFASGLGLLGAVRRRVTRIG